MMTGPLFTGYSISKESICKILFVILTRRPSLRWRIALGRQCCSRCRPQYRPVEGPSAPEPSSRGLGHRWWSSSPCVACRLTASIETLSELRVRWKRLSKIINRVNIDSYCRYESYLEVRFCKVLTFFPPIWLSILPLHNTTGHPHFRHGSLVPWARAIMWACVPRNWSGLAPRILYKLKLILTSTYHLILKSHLEDRFFRVRLEITVFLPYGSVCTSW